MPRICYVHCPTSVICVWGAWPIVSYRGMVSRTEISILPSSTGVITLLPPFLLNTAVFCCSPIMCSLLPVDGRVLLHRLCRSLISLSEWPPVQLQSCPPLSHPPRSPQPANAMQLPNEQGRLGTPVCSVV